MAVPDRAGSASQPYRPCVLVTRPAGQADVLLARLQDAGFDAVHAPALAICPLPLTSAQQRLLMDVDHHHAVFFVSPNAARLGVAALGDLWPQWPVGVHWLAVGDATAAILRAAGLPAASPADGFNSEAVLTLPCLQSLAEKKVLILRGDSGRELFADTLRARGAQVQTLALYRRECAAEFTWPAVPVDAVLVTSVESWQCLSQRAGAQLEGRLIVAGSARIADTLRAAGHEKIEVAASPHDEDMLACLKTCLINHSG